jgi:hypothetical protein
MPKEAEVLQLPLAVSVTTVNVAVPEVSEGVYTN